jgi:biopolymer transport protein ExbD
VKIRTHSERRAPLESVAITDIILNIFIFFFTAFSLVYTFNPQRESHIQLKLAQADIRPQPVKSQPLVVNLDARGRIFLGAKPVALEGLPARVRAALAGDPLLPVIVRSDKRVVFERVVQVIEAVTAGGAGQLAVAVEDSRKAQRGK